MNTFLQKALEHLDFLVAHPSESVIIFSSALILSILVLNYLYKERIATLKERVRLRDDQVDFYKNINAELEKQKQEINAAAPRVEIPQQSSQSGDLQQETQEQTYETNQIKQSLFDAINSRKQNGLAASSMQIIQQLQSKYDLGDILSELVRLYHGGKITWDNAPTFPEHWMELKIHNAP